MKEENKLKLNIQYFAEEGNDAETNLNAGVDNAGASVQESNKPKTLQELLDSDKNYKSEFDSKITKATETAVKNAKVIWEKEQADKVAESQKLAQMDEIQKKDYEIDNLKKQLAQRDADKQATDLMNEAIKQASSKGIPLEVMTELNYKNETAESIAKKIDVYAKAFQTIKTSAINEYSKEKAPQTGDYQGETKDESQMSYEELCKLEKYKN